MNTIWSRMSPRFVRYLFRLGFRLINYYLQKIFRLEAKEMEFKNIEGEKDYNFIMPNKNKTNGIAAIIRAKNEEDKIAYSLSSIYPVFDQIVIVNNNSTDKTREIVEDFIERFDKQKKIELFDYPFSLARCGTEHNDTDEFSVHNITYLTNFAISKCKVKIVCRWDADMILRSDSRNHFTNFIKKIRNGTQFRWGLIGQSLFRDLNGNFHTCDKDLDMEPRIFPFSYHNRFFKNNMFECLYSPLYRRVLPFSLYYELKFVDADEFSHWSSNELPAGRVSREHQHLSKLAKGEKLGEGFNTFDSDYLDKEFTLSMQNTNESESQIELSTVQT